MPSYDLVCETCGNEEEVLCSYDDAISYTCCECDSACILVMPSATLHGLPTPKFHGKVPKYKDKVFKAELDSIYEDDPLDTP